MSGVVQSHGRLPPVDASGDPYRAHALEHFDVTPDCRAVEVGHPTEFSQRNSSRPLDAAQKAELRDVDPGWLERGILDRRRLSRCRPQGDTITLTDHNARTLAIPFTQVLLTAPEKRAEVGRKPLVQEVNQTVAASPTTCAMHVLAAEYYTALGFSRYARKAASLHQRAVEDGADWRDRFDPRLRIVILAMQYGAMGVVSALRATSVVYAAIIG
jgi:hypothetical protein